MKDRHILGVFILIGVIGGLSIFTLPFRHPVQEAETLPEHKVTLDAAISEAEDQINRNKLYLDSLLESEKLKQAHENEMKSEPETEQETEEEGEISEVELETEGTTVHIPKMHPVDDCMMDRDLQEWLIQYASQREINPYLIMAICERESGCTARILGDNGKSYGIMQVQPRWQQQRLAEYGFTSEDLLYAENCIMVGTDILKDYQSKGYSLEVILMAYNGGEDYALSQIGVSEYAQWVINRTQYLQSHGIY